MTKSMITRRSILGGLAALPVVAVQAAIAAQTGPTTAPAQRAVLGPETLPAWRGPGFYEFGPDGERILVHIDTHFMPASRSLWFAVSIDEEDQAAGGTWYMPERSLATMNIRRIG